MEITKQILADSLDKYFQVLKRVGYKSKEDVHSLVILCIIDYLLSNFEEYITEENLGTLCEALYMIGGTCLISFPNKPDKDTLFKEIKNYLQVRYTELNEPRVAENSILRNKA